MRCITAAAIAISAVTPGIQAQETQRALNLTEIASLTSGGATAGSSGVSGIRTTVLSGDPTKSGPYTIELRVPAHTQIAAHSHRDDRSAVVVSGTWFFAYGAKADYSKMKTLGAGSFYTEPGKAPHFAMTGNDAAVVYITGVGPTDTKYVDSTKTPRPPSE